MKDVFYLVLGVVLIIVAWLIMETFFGKRGGGGGGSGGYMFLERWVDTVVVRDTVVIRGPGRVVWRVEERVDLDTVFVRDSVSGVDTVGFEACLDTVGSWGSLSVCYVYPVNEFTVRFFVKPDTIRIGERVFGDMGLGGRVDWWERAGYVGVGLASGLVLGLIVGR